MRGTLAFCCAGFWFLTCLTGPRERGGRRAGPATTAMCPLATVRLSSAPPTRTATLPTALATCHPVPAAATMVSVATAASARPSRHATATARATPTAPASGMLLLLLFAVCRLVHLPADPCCFFAATPTRGRANSASSASFRACHGHRRGFALHLTPACLPSRDTTERPVWRQLRHGVHHHPGWPDPGRVLRQQRVL